MHRFWFYKSFNEWIRYSTKTRDGLHYIQKRTNRIFFLPTRIYLVGIDYLTFVSICPTRIGNGSAVEKYCMTRKHFVWTINPHIHRRLFIVAVFVFFCQRLNQYLRNFKICSAIELDKLKLSVTVNRSKIFTNDQVNWACFISLFTTTIFFYPFIYYRKTVSSMHSVHFRKLFLKLFIKWVCCNVHKHMYDFCI